MNKFAGNIVLKGNKLIKDLGFDYVENMSSDGNKVLYIFGETDKKTLEELLDYFIMNFGELVDSDISISTEDKIEILSGTYDEGFYELATYEGEDINFDIIKDRFMDFDGVISIRESEISKRFGNRVIKVDFVY